MTPRVEHAAIAKRPIKPTVSLRSVRWFISEFSILFVIENGRL